MEHGIMRPIKVIDRFREGIERMQGTEDIVTIGGAETARRSHERKHQRETAGKCSQKINARLLKKSPNVLPKKPRKSGHYTKKYWLLW